MNGPTLSRGRRWTIVAILAVAILTGFGAVVATWVKRQALDTNNWTNTSSQLLENPKVQAALGTYLVDQVFTNVDVPKQLQQVLPPQLAGLAGPAAAELHQVATRAAPDLLARPAVQQLWRNSNQAAHKELLLLLDGGRPALSTTNGRVVLNLRPIVDQLAKNLGVEKQVAAVRSKLKSSGGGAAAKQKLGLPADAGTLTVMTSDELKSGQDTAKAIRGASILLTIVSLGLFALTVWLAPGHRRVMLRRVGWSFFAIGLATVLMRRIGGNYVADNLSKIDSVKQAIHASWLIGSSLLYDIGAAFIAYGLLIVAGAWLAGPTRLGIATRRAMSPSLRDHPGRVYAGAALVFALVLVWGPTPAFRHLLPILLIAGLVALGIETIRRQATAEFPDSRRGDTTHAFKTWSSGLSRAPVAAAPAPGNGARVVDPD